MSTVTEEGERCRGQGQVQGKVQGSRAGAGQGAGVEGGPDVLPPCSPTSKRQLEPQARGGRGRAF